MDWYYGNGIDELVFPKDQELSDRLPSPESWSSWGVEHFPGKCFTLDANMTPEEQSFSPKSLCNEVDTESSVTAKDQSSFSSIPGEILESPNQILVSHHKADYHVDDLAGFEQMDDIFLNSLLDDLPGNEDLQKSSQHDTLVSPADHLLADMTLDSISTRNKHKMGSSKYLQKHAFSPSASLEKADVPELDINSDNIEAKNSLTPKAPHANMLTSREHSSRNRCVTEETSLEESVLQELETVMEHLHDKTRICFRDAFFRLAKNSKENKEVQRKTGDLPTKSHPLKRTIHDEKNRSGDRSSTESKTNIIDRAVANLMFNKMDTNIRDFPVGTLRHSTSQQEDSSDISQVCYYR